MSTDDSLDEAVDVLQELGLKEYEARCFVGLSRLETATAKRLSEITEVPRTRVYDAVRVLEAQGLVEVQHASPQRFRAVPLTEATTTLRERYESRVDRLTDVLHDIDRVEADDDSAMQEVWSMSGRDAIAARVRQLLRGAEDEVILVIGEESLLTDELVDCLNELDGATVVIGATSEAVSDRIREAVPAATTFVSGLGWLHGMEDGDEETTIGRLLLVDRANLLVSSLSGAHEEQAVFGSGFQNGIVIVARRLMAQGLLPDRDPGNGSEA
jgi:sugar-specific transcriptional regulator TrmB